MPRFLTAALILAATSAFAAPRVATDIAPVHSLASQVMEGVGAPDLILPVGASPHAYSMRPSEAAALQEADIVFWIGEGLTPWLERSLENLSGDAIKVELLKVEGAQFLSFREDARFEAHDDDRHEGHGSGHAAGGRKDEKHGDKDHANHKDDADHKDHAHEENHANDEHAGHDHDGLDPHAWLDPEIAKRWLDVMAAALAEADPANEAAYAINSAKAKARIDATSASVAVQLGPVRGAQYIVFHDAYQYFERHFDIPAFGAIALSDASKPGPARIAEIRDYVKHNRIICVFTEPQFNSGVVEAAFEGTGVKTGVLDPMGAALTPGPAFYGDLLAGLAATMADCLSN